MKALGNDLVQLANAFKVEFINFYFGISSGEFITCYPHPRVIYLLNCAAPAQLDDGTQTVIFERGMWLLIPPMVKVRHIHRENFQLSIHFNCTPGNMELTALFDTIQYARANELLEIVDKLSPEADDPVKFVNAADLTVRYVLHQLLMKCNIDSVAAAENLLRYQELTEWLIKKSDLRIKVAEMAHFMHLGEETFARKFTADMQITPKKFNEKIVLNHSIQLLGVPDLSLKEIAQKLHLADEYHFSRFFKRNMQIPPGRFRKKILHEQCG